MPKPTYATVVAETVRKSGLASRAQIAKEAKAQGCDKGPLLKKALQKAVKGGTLEMMDKSYILGAKVRTALKGELKDRYEKMLEKAVRGRTEATEKKVAGRARMEAKYAANYVAAITGAASSWNRGVLGE